MRVLHLYAGNLFGGIERALLACWRARHAAPHMRPHFGLCFDGQLARALRADGAPLEILGDVRLSRPWTAGRARRRLWAVLSRERFDVIITHSLWPHVVFGPAVRGAGLPLVTWLHDVPRPDGWLEWLAQRVPADLMLANSRYTACRAAQLFPLARIEVQYPPIELHAPEDRSARAELRAGPDAFVVLIASRLQLSKGHTILLDALAMLPREIDWQCWIAGCAQRPGERRYLESLQAQARALRIDSRVRFLGHREDVPRLLGASDVLCQPNLEPEGFGLAFVEAMAAGVPVVTSDLGAARELLDASSGILVPPNDAQAVAEALRSVAAGRTRGSGRARVEQMCGAARVVPHLAAVLERVRARRAATA